MSAIGDFELCGARLGVSLRVEGNRLRVRNLETGNIYKWHADRHAKLIAVDRARQAAEQRIAELEAQL